MFGPMRYDLAGARAVAANRARLGRVSYPLPRAAIDAAGAIDDDGDGGGVGKLGEQAARLTPPPASAGALGGESALEADDLHPWASISDVFLCVNAAIVSCRCKKAPRGMAPALRAGGGMLQLVLVRKCSRQQVGAPGRGPVVRSCARGAGGRPAQASTCTRRLGRAAVPAAPLAPLPRRRPL